MATTSKTLYRGAAATSSATLYTTPASTTTIVTNIVVTNTTVSPQTFTLVMGGTTLADTVTVSNNDSTVIDLKQVLTATQTITVDDNILPTASNPATTTVPGGPAPATDPTVVTDEADNCSTPVVAFVSDVSDGNTCNGEIITRTYSITDACGNTATASQNITLIDNVAPVITCPEDIDIQSTVIHALEIGNIPYDSIEHHLGRVMISRRIVLVDNGYQLMKKLIHYHCF